jgi:membrane fusion protein (multidrug efflux system)
MNEDPKVQEQYNKAAVKKWASIVTALFAVIILVFLIIWLVWWRFEEETDDAYVNGNMIMITPQQKGIITTILADNTQLVDEGQPLLELDKADYEIAFNRAKADLGNAVRSVVQMFVKVKEVEAKRDSARADFLRACLDYKHRKELVFDQSVSEEDFEHSQTTAFSAFSAYRAAEQELDSARARVGNTTVSRHPEVEKAKANLQAAFLDLHRCVVRAPAKGIITQRKAQVGQWVQAADTLMSLVPVDQVWVDANYREVDLRHLRIGQPVELESDMYGDDVIFHGTIVGLNPGTGSVFSILPPQNASGNWIKIIQRVPVKISLDPEEIKKYPLILGLSMTATTYTHDRSGPRLSRTLTKKPIYKTNVYSQELEGVDEMTRMIIADNIVLNDYK